MQPDIVYAATMKGDILGSIDGRFCYELRCASDMPDARWTVLLPHPTEKDLLFFGSQRGSMVSKDGGMTWSYLYEGSKAKDFYADHIMPADQAESSLLFATTQGLFTHLCYRWMRA
jgi:hypothetical protein